MARRHGMFSPVSSGCHRFAVSFTWASKMQRGPGGCDDEEPRLMRCDLHVHTLHSGPVDIAVLRRVSRECYSQPAEAYATARRRGMDLVTITDHDTIEGTLQLAGRPDFFVSEEVTCGLPEGRELHLGVFDLNEAQHEQISRRRRDPEALFAYLAEQRLAACVNHLFSPLT